MEAEERTSKANATVELKQQMQEKATDATCKGTKKDLNCRAEEGIERGMGGTKGLGFRLRKGLMSLGQMHQKRNLKRKIHLSQLILYSKDFVSSKSQNDFLE